MPGVFKLLQKLATKGKKKCFKRVLILRSKRKCTSFILTDGKFCVTGRTMEHSPWMTANTLLVQPKGRKFRYGGLFGFEKETRFGYLKNVAAQKVSKTSGFELNGSCEGMNEAGLSIDMNAFAESSHYPNELKKGPEKDVYVHELIDFILGNYDNTQTLKNDLENFNVCKIGGSENVYEAVFPFHFHVVDKKGDGLVIEFTTNENGEGAQNLYKSCGVLTNEPPYPFHLKNLTLYPQLTNRISEDNWKVEVGHGSGLLGLPGDPLPPSRFVRASKHKEFVEKENIITQNGDNDNSAIVQASQIINNVTIVKGMCYDNKESTVDKTSWDFTIWSVIKDCANVKYLIRPYNDLGWTEIDIQRAVEEANQKAQESNNFEAVQVAKFDNNVNGSPWIEQNKGKPDLMSKC